MMRKLAQISTAAQAAAMPPRLATSKAGAEAGGAHAEHRAPPRTQNLAQCGCVQRHRAVRLGQRPAELETAGHRAAACRPAPPHAAPRAGRTTMRALAHMTLCGALAEDAPAGGGDLGHIGLRVHLGKQHQPGGIAGIDGKALAREERGETGAAGVLVLAPDGTPRPPPCGCRRLAASACLPASSQSCPGRARRHGSPGA